MSYPMCPVCGHNLSALIGGPDNGRCTVFVAYPVGDPRGLAGYCYHNCGQEPEIRAWLDLPPLPTDDGS